MSSKEKEPPPPDPPTPFPETEPQIREAVLDFYKKKICFDKRPIKYMTLTATTPMSAYRYILETFVETRVISSRTKPFRGQKVPDAKSTPEKWSVKAPPPPAPPGNTVVEFHETSKVILCPNCGATGRVVCLMCEGRGSTRCISCSGWGSVTKTETDSKGKSSSHSERCFSCSGTGRRECMDCHWRGWLTCLQCEGLTKVVTWDILTVTWTLDVKTHNTSRGDLSHELLDKVQYSGVGVSQLSTPQHPRPLKFPPEPDITTMAAKYVGGMMAQKDWKVIAFRQAVVDVPIVKVDWTWKDHVGTFYVYGADKWIHFPDKYPGSPCGACCCCGNSPCVIA